MASEIGKLTGTPWMDWLANTGDRMSDFVVNNNPATYARALTSGVLGVVPGMEDAAAWVEPTRADTVMRNTTPNTSQVHGLVKRYATLLAHSGQVGDATEALRVAVDYIRRPEVSTQVNGTLYLRSELPAAPNASRTQGEWLERFIDAVPKARAKDLKFPGSPCGWSMTSERISTGLLSLASLSRMHRAESWPGRKAKSSSGIRPRRILI